MVRLKIALVFLLLIFPAYESIVFHRTFGLKHEDKLPGATRVKRKEGILTKAAKIDLIPRIPAEPTESPKRIVPQNYSDGFNICKTQQPCANNGVCIPDGNGYYCECLSLFYGEKCQFVADKRECANNLCQNDSTCYSVNEERVAVGVLQKDPVKVKYMCWCKKGFTGDFCDYTEKMRECAEDYCNHHGIINLRSFKDKDKCSCECEKYYSGNNCENVSPCRDFECINEGECKLKPNGEPYCECPNSLKLSSSARVFGDHCESIEFPDTIDTQECRPCVTNFVDYLNCLKSKGIDVDAMSDWWKPCEEHISGCLTNYLANSNCLNNGKCVAAVKKFSLNSNVFNLAIPRCECTPDFEGMFCERRVLNACEKLSKDQKCVNGKCVFNSTLSEAQCLCNPGYYGQRCEFKRPCTSHDCGDAMCVELPASPGSQIRFPVCVCNTSQLVDDKTFRCTNPHFQACLNADGSPKCKNDSYCYPCLQDNDKNSVANACNDDQWVQGFRCICAPGYAPPLCDRRLGPCDRNRCKNNSKCVPIGKDSLEYSCECRKGFTGRFCEVSLGACAQNDHICKNGTCKNDVHFKRGFYCECNDNFFGINCEIDTETNFFDRYNEHYVWTYPLTLFICLALILVVTVLVREYFEDSEDSESNQS